MNLIFSIATFFAVFAAANAGSSNPSELSVLDTGPGHFQFLSLCATENSGKQWKCPRLG